MAEKTVDLRIENVDPRLHRDYKTLVTLNGSSMREQLIASMIAYVAKNSHKLNLDEDQERNA